MSTRVRSAGFKTADFNRVVKAARANGLTISRTEITPDGRIIFDHVPTLAPQSRTASWRAERDARTAEGR